MVGQLQQEQHIINQERVITGVSESCVAGFHLTLMNNISSGYESQHTNNLVRKNSI
jgi:hypothetical protein